MINLTTKINIALLCTVFILSVVRITRAQDEPSKSGLSLSELENKFLEPTDPYYFFGEIWEYRNYRNDNNAFLYNRVSLEGNITFNKRTFQNVKFAYDIETDKVIAQKPGESGKIIYVELPDKYLENFDFTIDDYPFEFLKSSSENYIHPELKEGIYEVVYKNDLQLLINHSKQYQFSQNNKSIYIASKKTYLIVNGNLYKINKNKDLYKIFPDQKKEIGKYLRKNRIKIQMAYNQQLKPLINYIEKL